MHSCLRRQHAFAAVDLDPLILTRADNAHRLVPAHAEHLDAFTANPLAIRLALLLQALPGNRVNTLANNTLLIGLGGPDIPNSARAVVATANETICAVGVTGQADNSVGVASESHGSHSCGRCSGINQSDMAGSGTGSQEAEFGEVLEGEERV